MATRIPPHPINTDAEEELHKPERLHYGQAIATNLVRPTATRDVARDVFPVDAVNAAEIADTKP